MISYPQHTALPKDYVHQKFNEFLEEDSAFADKTSIGTVPENKIINGFVEAQGKSVFAGSEVLEAAFHDFPSFQILVNDGDRLDAGTLIAKFEANARVILRRERVLLNLLQKMCGIAYQTSHYADLARPYGVKILDTRKTTPGLRLFEKFAVTCGGGFNHRFSLSDGILIKDNHITAAGSIENAVSLIKEMDYGLPIELEVDFIDQIEIGLALGVDGFLLDNMTRELTFEAVKLIRSSENGNDIFIESSGGINLDNITNYLDTGINAISIGALTHSVKAGDIHLELQF